MKPLLTKASEEALLGVARRMALEWKVRPLVVESDRHAKELFELTGEKWSVGDKFYQAYTEDGLITSRCPD